MSMAENKLHVLSRQDVRQALSMREAIELMRQAFVQLAQGKAVVPVRMTVEMEPEQGRVLLMPVYLPDARQAGLKLVSIMDRNPEHGLPYIQALVMVLDAANGRPLAIMDGEHLTALRTGAASGLATDLLARKDARVAAIIGAGAQAQFQLEAVCQVRRLERIIVFNRTFARAQQFAERMQPRLQLPVEAVQTVDAVADADIICTATTATAPVLPHRLLKAGAHINAIGAYKPDMCELSPQTVVQATVVVDHKPSCLSEAGDLVQPLQNGLIDESHIYAELGELASGSKAARRNSDEVTVFKSVGNAVQDLVAAARVLDNANRLGLGSVVSL